MISFNKTFIIACVIGLPLLTACSNPDELYSVRRSTIDVGSANIGDSVCATFTFKNHTAEELDISFIPDCDCTTLDRDFLKLGPHKRGQLKVKVAVEKSGEFIKYVYVNKINAEDFMILTVKGHTK